jgi:uncharacterized ion transporter superfamily protein YfcC
MTKVRRWYDWIPHPVVMLFGMLFLAALMSYIIPAGKFDRINVDGKDRVVAGSYKVIQSDPLSLMDVFLAIPGGFKTAIDIIFIILASGIMFGFMERSGAVENAVGTLVKHLGLRRRFVVVWIMTFVFGGLGIFVGYENNIAMVPVACVLSLAIGGDLMLAAGISVAAITVGFGLSPINFYTIGTGHKIAELPIFSGWLLRSILCFSALSFLAFYNIRYFKSIISNPLNGLSAGIDTSGFALTHDIEAYKMRSIDKLVILSFIASLGIIVYGVFVYNWHINHTSAVFCMLAIWIAIITRCSQADFGATVLQSVGHVAPGAFMVGLATSIKVALDMGNITDTIAHHLSSSLIGLPLTVSAVGMTFAQTFLNFIIPSGSGQALASLPVMIPVGEVIGLTRQTTVLAFQVGDGVSNLINPSLGGIVAMLAMCRIPFDRWLRFIFPLFWAILLISIIFVIISVMIGYGPF